MESFRIDRRKCLALVAAWLAVPRSALATPRRAAFVSEGSPTRFATGSVATGKSPSTGPLVVAPDEVELTTRERARSFALSKLRELALEPRDAEAVAGKSDAELEALAVRLLANPRDGAAIEGWLSLLRRGYTGPRVLGPPLAGDVWIVPDPTRHHAAHVASAFALDLAVLGENGRVHAEDGKRNADYASWDAPLLAVADGRVERARDHHPDDAAFEGVADPERANDLVLAYDGGLAFYQHLRQGSLAVKTGATVRRGDVLARVGNSGNASWPHLHFAVYERFGSPPNAGSLSIPIQVERYELAGLKRDVAGKAKKLSVACRNVPLQEGWTVRFEAS